MDFWGGVWGWGGGRGILSLYLVYNPKPYILQISTPYQSWDMTLNNRFSWWLLGKMGSLIIVSRVVVTGFVPPTHLKNKWLLWVLSMVANNGLCDFTIVYWSHFKDSTSL